MNPKYVILDTGVWLDFLRDVEGERMLCVIEELQRKNVIKLIVPNLVEEEWKNNYSNHTQPKLEKYVLSSSVSMAETLYDTSNQLRKGIVSRVEKLFSMAIKPALSDKVKAQATDRRMSRLAPFHNKKDSIFDCLIYFSSAEWCIENQIHEMTFVTNNIKDFSDPADKQMLHPELMAPNLNVVYHVYLNLFLSTVDKGWSKRQEEKKHDEVIVLPELVTDEPIISQWDKAFEYYYRHLHYIPRRLVSRLYPMCNSNKNPMGYYDRGIHVNNEAVVDYLLSVKDIDFKEDFAPAAAAVVGQKDFDKSKEIFKALNQVHIYELKTYQPELKFDCFIKLNTTCCCVRCRFRHLRLDSSLLALLSEPTDDIHENLKQGYVRFLVRDYVSSANFFYQVYQSAKADKLPVIQLAMAQNLKKLSRWIKDFARSEEVYQQIEKFKVEDADDVYAANMQLNTFVIESSKLIYREHFFLTVKSQIVKLRNEIAAHYKTQLSGGQQSNTNLNNLFYTFAELKSFYEINSLIINLNNEALRELYTYVAESYLMCHQFNKRQSSRLKHFDDYIILEMALYAKHADLKRHFADYKLNTLRYYYSSDYSDTVNVIIQLLEDLPRFANFGWNKEELYSFQTLTDDYYGYLNNLIFLCSYLTFTDEDNRRIADTIVQLIKILDPYPQFYNSVPSVILFLSLKHTFFTWENLVDIIQYSFKVRDWQKDDWLRQMGDCVSARQSPILEKNLSLSELVHNYFTALSNNETIETKIHQLASWYSVLHPLHKVKIRDSITQQLRENFTPNLYYFSVIHEICDYQEFYKAYIDTVGVPLRKEGASESSLFPTYERLGDLLNLVFCLNLSTSGEEFDKFRNHRDYYDWLLDLEHYDYIKFDISWVVRYQTRYYFQRIFGSKQCREEIRVRLVESPNAYISHLYLKYAIDSETNHQSKGFLLLLIFFAIISISFS